MRDKPPACAGCPAATYGLGFVPPTVPPQPAEWVVVGQGPGQQEAVFSTPFYPNAPSGRMLRGWLYDAHIPEAATAFGNAVCCWLPKQLLSGGMGRESRPPTAEEVKHCWQAHVRPWLESMPSSAHVIAVGATATRLLLGLPHNAPVNQLVGVTHTMEELPVV